ncbi:MAG: 4a-hydroxytetrahydrobiopterin dehydratase [Acidobacteriaceae bacterium]
MSKLSQPEIADKLRALPDWHQKGDALVRDYEFADFTLAFAFVARLALLAEKAGHHPDIDIRYNKVRVGLTSHDAGGVTSRDVAMAAAIGKLL